MKLFTFFNNAYAGEEKLWKVFVFGWLLPLLPLTIASKIAEEIGIKNPSSNVTYGLLVYCFFIIGGSRCRYGDVQLIQKQLTKSLLVCLLFFILHRSF
jgi:hypothetical protein